MTSEEEMKQSVYGLYKALSESDLDKLLSFFSDNAKLIAGEGEFTGKAGVKQYYEWMGTQVHNIRFPEKNLVIAGDLVFHEFVLEGTTPDGRGMRVPTVNVYRFKEGKISELCKYYDRLLVGKQGAKGWLAQNLVNTIESQMKKGL
jgi:ketosteroid isomerase-like protein